MDAQLDIRKNGRSPKSSGVVYVLRNPYATSAEGTALLKIGGSSRSAYQRARELSSATGVPGKFDVVCEVPTKNWRQLENLVHRDLRKIRRSKEFFEVSVDTAIAQIKRVNARIDFLKENNGPYSECSSELELESGACFVSTARGVKVFYDRQFMGNLLYDDTSAFYELLLPGCSDEILYNEIFCLPGQGNKWSRFAVERCAMKRAAWITKIIARFLNPSVFMHKREDIYLAKVFGIHIATINARRRKTGWFKKKEELYYDWKKENYRSDLSIIENLGCDISLSESHFCEDVHPFEFGTTDISKRYVQDHVRRHVRAYSSMSDQMWQLHVEVLNYCFKFRLSLDTPT